MIPLRIAIGHFNFHSLTKKNHITLLNINEEGKNIINILRWLANILNYNAISYGVL